MLEVTPEEMSLFISEQLSQLSQPSNISSETRPKRPEVEYAVAYMQRVGFWRRN